MMESGEPEASSRLELAGQTDDALGYERFIKQGKEETKNRNFENAIKLFNKAYKIHPSEKLKGRIEKLEEALAAWDLKEEEDDEFVNVLSSGLMLFRDLYEKLYLHQKEGVAFLYSLYRDERKGGILADDMGLGKTIQIIAFLSAMFDADLIKNVLVVMPTTLISNWSKEFSKWTPGMRVKEFHGTSKSERSKNLERIQRRGGVLITTYQMLVNNWQQLSTVDGSEFTWDYIILDEAHKIKTPSAKTTKCAHCIPVKNRILLTGTPVQNNLCEMWSLFDFACQGSLLGTSKTFKMEYENPITRAREKDATPGERVLGLRISENLMNIIKPYFLRRTKEDVQNKKSHETKEDESKNVVQNSNNVVMPSLTRKNDLIVWVYLSQVQEEIYRNFLSLDEVKEVLMTTKTPLTLLNVLKKLCDHPRLLSARACRQLGLESPQDIEDLDSEAESGNSRIDGLSDETLVQESGKLIFLIGLLERLRDEGHQTLVFSQSRKMLDIIHRILSRKGFKIMRIDGTISHIAEREKRISVFQSNKDYAVFLLTTQVGGVGITLTAATRVVIFDPSWNPATDAQAVDRAYRIGQKENVVIYRLITCSTVEEKIYRRQVFKESLIRQTTGDKKNPFRYFTKQELKELFTLEDPRMSTTQLQLQSMHAAHRRTDTELDEHIAFLHTLEIFGVSDHDLMYSQDAGTCDLEDDDEAQQYIENRVQKAHELVQAESQLNQQLMQQLKDGTEPAWLGHPELFARPKERKPAKSELNSQNKPLWGEESEYLQSEVIDLRLDGDDYQRVGHNESEVIDLDMNEDEIQNISCKIKSMVIEESLEQSEKDAFVTDRSVSGHNTSQPSDILAVSFSQPLNPSSNSTVTKETMQVKSENKSVLLTDEASTPSNFETGCANKAGHNSDAAVTIIQAPENCEDVEMSSPLPKSLHHHSDSETADVKMSISHHIELSTDVTQELLELQNPNQAEASQFEETTSQLQCDFNLVLEDSVSDENFGSSVSHLKTGTDLKNITASSQLNISAVESLRELSRTELHDQDVSSPVHLVKRKMRRIISDSEEEENDDVAVFEMDEKVAEKLSLQSPLNSSFHTNSTSTPKQTALVKDSFSHRKSSGGNHSISSRRSLVNVVVEDLEELQETVDDNKALSIIDAEEEENWLVEQADEGSESDASSEEEPDGESLHTVDTNGYESEIVLEGSKQVDSFVEESSSEEMTDIELASNEEVHSFAQKRTELEPDQVQLLAEQNMPSLGESCNPVYQFQFPAKDEYEILVNRGKNLMSNGKLQDALAVFLQALDLKSGDPEIQLLTISLYRKLSQK